jgi:hypothetical protein
MWKVYLNYNIPNLEMFTQLENIEKYYYDLLLDKISIWYCPGVIDSIFLNNLTK